VSILKNEFSDMTLPREKLYGIFRGIVEDNLDPEQQGRCKIRVFGVHSQNKIKTSTDGIPTDELLWAEPVLSLIEGSITGQGLFSVPLVNSHVFVFFESGHILQPRYFATVPAKGDWNTKVSTYPHNIVLETHAGHYIEIDSSPSNERIKVYHKTGTLSEIDKDGNIQITGVKNETINITDNVTRTVGGTFKDDVTGDVTETFKSNWNVNVTGNISITSSSDITVQGVNVNVTASGVCTISGSPVNIN